MPETFVVAEKSSDIGSPIEVVVKYRNKDDPHNQKIENGTPGNAFWIIFGPHQI